MDLWLLPSAAQINALGLSGFQNAIKRADRMAPIDPGLDPALQAAFGWEFRPPWAAWLANADPNPGQTWMLADLIHLQAEVSSARVMALAVDSDPEHPDLPLLFDALRPWLAEEAIEVVSVQGGRALLRSPSALGDPGTSAPDAVLGCDLRDLLPANLVWQRRINELQIVLTQHSCNAGRLTRQLPPWNCLWFWGHGRDDPQFALPLTRVASSDPLLLALARRSGLPAINHDEASTGSALRDLRDPRHLQLVWDAGIRPHDALLRCADGSGWRLKPAHRLRFWRR